MMCIRVYFSIPYAFPAAQIPFADDGTNLLVIA